jgi:5-(carboxyamino)imidazole ribonucleotide synthase
VLQQDLAKLHLYGKKEARPGRKMGHINCLGASREDANSLLEKVRQILA